VAGHVSYAIDPERPPDWATYPEEDLSLSPSTDRWSRAL
jgi:hypothetical protein